MLATSWRTFSSSPRTMDETPMTTATPITMPSTVSDERSLLLRMVSVAICTISPNSPFCIMSSVHYVYISNRNATIGSSRAALRAG